MTTRTRIIVDIIILIASFTLPWWLVAPVAVICLFAFKNFYEILAIGFIFDSLYGVTLPWLKVALFYFFISAILLIAVNPLKRRLKFDF